MNRPLSLNKDLPTERPLPPIIDDSLVPVDEPEELTVQELLQRELAAGPSSRLPSVTFASIDSSLTVPLSIRRSKSFSKDETTNKAKRRLSLAPTVGSLFKHSPDPKGKAKADPPLEPLLPLNDDPKSIARKPSFWSRKRVNSTRSKEPPPLDIAPLDTLPTTSTSFHILRPRSSSRPSPYDPNPSTSFNPPTLPDLRPSSPLFTDANNNTRSSLSIPSRPSFSASFPTFLPSSSASPSTPPVPSASSSSSSFFPLFSSQRNRPAPDKNRLSISSSGHILDRVHPDQAGLPLPLAAASGSVDRLNESLSGSEPAYSMKNGVCNGMTNGLTKRRASIRNPRCSESSLLPGSRNTRSDLLNSSSSSSIPSHSHHSPRLHATLPHSFHVQASTLHSPNESTEFGEQGTHAVQRANSTSYPTSPTSPSSSLTFDANEKNRQLHLQHARRRSKSLLTFGSASSPASPTSSSGFGVLHSIMGRSSEKGGHSERTSLAPSDIPSSPKEPHPRLSLNVNPPPSTYQQHQHPEPGRTSTQPPVSRFARPRSNTLSPVGPTLLWRLSQGLFSSPPSPPSPRLATPAGLKRTPSEVTGSRFNNEASANASFEGKTGSSPAIVVGSNYGSSSSLGAARGSLNGWNNSSTSLSSFPKQNTKADEAIRKNSIAGDGSGIADVLKRTSTDTTKDSFILINRSSSQSDLGADPPAKSHSALSVVKSETTQKLKPEEGETPAMFLTRLIESLPKADVASSLASSPDTFYSQALHAYIARFDFTSDPLDVALRKLLMDLSLPRETQQIDRVMEAFAKRYETCNPKLFESEDHPYILAFSLMMLHTDAFNRSNKNKMSKADYIKNTRLPGLVPEVLECFYDNIVFAPFIFIEDPTDITQSATGSARGSINTEGTSTPVMLSSVAGLGGGHATNPGGSAILGRGSIDPYYLITQKLLVPLRTEVEAEIPQHNPYLYTGTAGSWEESDLQLAFAGAPVIQLTPGPLPFGSTTGRRRSAPLLVPNPHGPLHSGLDSADPQHSQQDMSPVTALKVAKFGMLSRKDDILSSGKRGLNRKWKDWGVMLTGSQLLFFRDQAWIAVLKEFTIKRENEPEATEDGKKFISPSGSRPSSSSSSAAMSTFHPEEILSLKDSIALYDISYQKYPNTFRFMMPGGRQFLLRASSQQELNEWMGLINYASAFKTAGIRTRPLAMTSDQAKSTGTAAAISHWNDLRRARQRLKSLPSAQLELPKTPASDISQDSDTEKDGDASLYLSTGPAPTESSTSVISTGSSTPVKGIKSTTSTPIGSKSLVELDSPTADQSDGRLEDTFLEVKAELAAGTSAVDPSKPWPALKLDCSKAALAPPGSAATLGRLRRLDPVSQHRPISRAISLGSLPPATVDSLKPHTDPHHRFSEQLMPNVRHGIQRNSRSIVIGTKIRELQSKIAATQSGLDSDIRVARNLAVLSPFTQSTRAKLVVVIPPLAKKIKMMRMDLAKLVCHRDILAADLQADEMEWRAMMDLAMSAAADKLKQRQAPTVEISPASANLLLHTEERDSFESTKSEIEVSSNAVVIPKSSVSSAGDHSLSPTPFTLPNTYSISPSQQSSPSLVTPISPHATRNDALQFGTSPTPEPSKDTPSPPTQPPDISICTPEERCEDWHKTKAAKRVSLVSFPSDRKLSTLSVLSRQKIVS